MNVCLQCLANTKGITEYLIDDTNWMKHVNLNNVMGRQGILISSFAQVVKDMWVSKESAIKPDTFKETLGKFKQEFKGYSQQDAQELLTFLIDGLHEEVNIVASKLYMDLSNSWVNNMEEAADEYWSLNLLRNWSIFSFIFTGLLGSELICSECKYKSWSFEPFMNLSLPITETMQTPLDLLDRKSVV